MQIQLEHSSVFARQVITKGILGQKFSGFTWQKQAEGYVCIDVDECAIESPCQDDATCVNNVGSYECQCNTGNIESY